MNDWGDGDSWLNDRQKMAELSKKQKVCQWLLNKSYCAFFAVLVLSFAVASPLPLYIFFAIEGTALLCLLISN